MSKAKQLIETLWNNLGPKYCIGNGKYVSISPENYLRGDYMVFSGWDAQDPGYGVKAKDVAEALVELEKGERK